MAREKSPLSPDIIFTLGRILNALTSANITEEVIRTVCRNVGITALGQSELSSCLKEFRNTISTPKDKLCVLADIIPEGFLLALLLVAQEFAKSQVTKVYQADVQANLVLQNILAVLENEKAEALAAAKTEAAKCVELAFDLNASQKTVSSLTERVMVLEKEASLLRGRLLGRDETKQNEPIVKGKRTTKHAGRGGIKVSIAEKPADAGVGKKPEASDTGQETGSGVGHSIAGGNA